MRQPPIKVMRIIARLNIGGPAIHVAMLTEQLSRLGYEQLLVYGQIGDEEGDMEYLLPEGTQKALIPELGREIAPFRDLRTLFKLYRLMRQYQPDIVDTHTAKAGFVGRTAAWLARVPVRVHTFHGHVFHGYFGPAKTRVFLLLERLCARMSTRIITISPKLRDELVETYHIAPSEKVVVIPLGLDLQKLVAPIDPPQISAWLAEQGIPADKKRVGIVGRLVPIKNHRLFLQAAQQIIRQRDDVHFVIVGDGECRAELEQLTQEWQLTDFFTFTGWIKDIGLVLHSLDVLALTSTNEGTPISVMEALAAGVPVVATGVGGVADVLDEGKYGLIVPPGDVAALTEALGRALNGDHPDLAAAQAAVLARYDVTRLVRETSELYTALLTDRRGC